jgi:hypothetical protein
VTDAAPIPVTKIIQDPDRYEGKPVKVVGYYVDDFESHGLYVSEADYRNAVTKNALWMAVDRSGKYRHVNRQWAVVEGIVDKANQGHLRLYFGAIGDITKVEAIPLQH